MSAQTESTAPEPLRRNVVGVFGAVGSAWLEDLPCHLARIERLWRVQIGPPLPGLSFHYVAGATLPDGTPVIVKTGVPNPESLNEHAALRHHAGRGAVRLLRSSRRLGALLLERLNPGASLLQADNDEEATRAAATVMARLWRPAPPRHRFRHVDRWAQGLGRLRSLYGGGTGPFPPDMVATAEGLFAELLASSGETVLLHGDLHHDNILRHGNAWLAIDPKGILGEPVYECGAWLRNPGDLLERPNAADLLSRRIAIFSEMLGFDRARIRDWAYAQAVLSAWWCVEDGGSGATEALEIARRVMEASL